MTSIAVGEDDFLVQEGLRRVLAETEDEFQLTGMYGDFESLVSGVARDRPNVVVTDIRMPPTHTDEGIRFAVQLREELPEIAVLVLSMHAGPAYALQLFEGGSEGRGYLLKDRVADRIQFIGAIREVARGGSVIDPKVVAALVATRSRSMNSDMESLTPREREVLAQIAQGKSNRAIANEFALTKGGVEKHVNAIFAKLDIASDVTVSKRVVATLRYLAEVQTPPVDG